MEAILLSYLYLFIDSNPKATEVGAGDLATSNLKTGLSKPPFYNSTQRLLASLYNEMVNGSLPGLVFNLPNFFFNKFVKWPSFWNADKNANMMMKTLKNIIPVASESVINYHYLWVSYLNNRKTVSVFCIWDDKTDCNNYIKKQKNDVEINYKIPSKESQFFMVERLRNETGNNLGILVEGDLNGPPCLDAKIIDKFKIQEICKMLNLISKNSNGFLKMMKYSIQSPVYIEGDEEYLSMFQDANTTISKKGYIFKENKVSTSFTRINVKLK